ncbi:ATP synthase subunit gamma mitochondrial [Phtheirospermum japonicum]|uniref:ATP synthase subunit gamma mitochondrial n=1 Tax=Phtheirospermum japonicum TaxID=374723 RepID=A0A830B3C1_9LAMI|nr:ATP synthase subunit gamma mitochondrial [Phtheirospermum japonicum]
MAPFFVLLEIDMDISGFSKNIVRGQRMAKVPPKKRAVIVKAMEVHISMILKPNRKLRKMVMTALRREGRQIAAPLICPHPIRPTIAPSEDQTLLGVRSISTQLRAIQSKAETSSGLWQPFTALLGDTPSVDVKKNVIVTISSDKGLCGGINSTSVKTSKGLHKLNSGPEKECKYVILGEKAKAQLVRDSKKDIELTLTELQKNPLNYTQWSHLCQQPQPLSLEVVERDAEARGKLGELDSYEIEGGETKSSTKPTPNLDPFQQLRSHIKEIKESVTTTTSVAISRVKPSANSLHLSSHLLSQPPALDEDLTKLSIYLEAPVE